MRIYIKTVIQSILLFSITTTLVAQNKLIFNTESVDSLLMWMQKGCSKNYTRNLAKQPAAQFMEQILRTHENNVPDYKKILDEFNCKDSTSGSFYLLNEVYKRQLKISELINEIKKSDFSERVYERAIKYFPDNYSPPRNYEVFFTPTGWQWGDAMSFDYIVNNGEYTLSDTGTPAIMFNVTLICSLYGNTLTEQMDAMENVMAHELFHAIFSDYIKENSLRWENENVNNKLLYLMLNEGLAHYISDGALIKEYYYKNDQLKQNEKQAFASLSDSAKVIFNIQNKEEIRNEALNSGLYGQYWDKLNIAPLFLLLEPETGGEADTPQS